MSLYQFEEQFRNTNSKMSVYEFFDSFIEELKAQDKISNARKYNNTKKALTKYKPSKSLLFSDIDFKFLKGFETHLYQKGCTGGGIHFYMRTLRALFNKAIQRGVIEQELYPFSTQFNKQGYSFSHLKSQYKPRPLTLDGIEAIKNFPIADYPDLQQAVYYFVFSYYANGMSFVDMAHLKYSNISDGRLHYHRQKTGKAMPSIKLNDTLQAIIQYFDCPQYLFPILSDRYQTVQQKENRIRKCIGAYNKDLKKVAAILQLEINLTSYVSRHTFGNVLKQKGVDVAVISELYGHENVNTTKHLFGEV